jgi:hypothetical protein
MIPWSPETVRTFDATFAKESATLTIRIFPARLSLISKLPSNDSA